MPPGSAWHERANAEQDWEEKGIPVPARFNPPPLIPIRAVPAGKVLDAIPPAR